MPVTNDRSPSLGGQQPNTGREPELSGVRIIHIALIGDAPPPCSVCRVLRGWSRFAELPDYFFCRECAAHIPLIFNRARLLYGFSPEQAANLTRIAIDNGALRRELYGNTPEETATNEP